MNRRAAQAALRGLRGLLREQQCSTSAGLARFGAPSGLRPAAGPTPSTVQTRGAAMPAVAQARLLLFVGRVPGVIGLLAPGQSTGPQLGPLP